MKYLVTEMDGRRFVASDSTSEGLNAQLLSEGRDVRSVQPLGEDPGADIRTGKVNPKRRPIGR